MLVKERVHIEGKHVMSWNGMSYLAWVVGRVVDVLFSCLLALKVTVGRKLSVLSCV